MMTVLPFILPAVCPTVRGYRNEMSSISSTRRNPVLADIFGRLGYMERQGSGFKKITESYRAAHNYRDELEPKFYSDASSFQVTLYNPNYGTAATASKVTIEDENIAIDRLNASQGTIAKAKAVFANMGVDGAFGRSDIVAITKDSVNALLWLLSVELCAAASGYTARERRRLGNNPSLRSCGSNRANEISWNLHGNTDSWSRSVQPGRYSLGHGFSQLSYQMRHGTTDKF